MICALQRSVSRSFRYGDREIGKAFANLAAFLFDRQTSHGGSGVCKTE